MISEKCRRLIDWFETLWNWLVALLEVPEFWLGVAIYTIIVGGLTTAILTVKAMGG